MCSYEWFRKRRHAIRQEYAHPEGRQRSARLFRSAVYELYRKKGRTFPWRSHVTDYTVFVSELMLQQTQTDRVVEKYLAFVERYPDFEALDKASLQQVLSMWQGLGYNRRALYLKRSAGILVSQYNGIIPDDVYQLQRLPGIGKATARSILAFARNRPVVFLETNVRTVYLWFFFADNAVSISDQVLEELVEITLDRHNPREWYSALMDCGAWIKKHVGNISRKSSSYRTQSRFEGSDRQIRGRILRLFTDSAQLSAQEIHEAINEDRDRVQRILTSLCKEGFMVTESAHRYTLTPDH